MRRALAKWRLLGVGVVWDVAVTDDTPRQIAAETMPQQVTVVHVVHYYVPLPPGTDPAATGIVQVLPLERDAIKTVTEQEGTPS